MSHAGMLPTTFYYQSFCWLPPQLEGSVNSKFSWPDRRTHSSIAEAAPQVYLKVISHFHLIQSGTTPVFFPNLHSFLEEKKLHTVDIIRAFLYYLDRTEPFRFSPSTDTSFWSFLAHPKSMPSLAENLSK